MPFAKLMFFHFLQLKVISDEVVLVGCVLVVNTMLLSQESKRCWIPVCAIVCRFQSKSIDNDWSLEDILDPANYIKPGSVNSSRVPFALVDQQLLFELNSSSSAMRQLMMNLYLTDTLQVKWNQSFKIHLKLGCLLSQISSDLLLFLLINLLKLGLHLLNPYLLLFGFSLKRLDLLIVLNFCLFNGCLCLL